MLLDFSSTALLEVILITPQVFGDERRFFMETYHRDVFAQGVIDTIFIQDNHSKSNPVALILRDNIFHGVDLEDNLKNIPSDLDGGMIFAYHVSYSERYGV